MVVVVVPESRRHAVDGPGYSVPVGVVCVTVVSGGEQLVVAVVAVGYQVSDQGFALAISHRVASEAPPPQG